MPWKGGLQAPSVLLSAQLRDSRLVLLHVRHHSLVLPWVLSLLTHPPALSQSLLLKGLDYILWPCLFSSLGKFITLLSSLRNNFWCTAYPSSLIFLSSPVIFICALPPCYSPVLHPLFFIGCSLLPWSSPSVLVFCLQSWFSVPRLFLPDILSQFLCLRRLMFLSIVYAQTPVRSDSPFFLFFLWPLLPLSCSPS